MCAVNHYPATSLRVAVAQAEPVAGDIVANVGQTVALIRRAVAQGAKVVLLPEKFLSGYEPALIKSDPARFAVGVDDERLAPISRICQAERLTAIVGAATLERGGIYITSLCFNEQGEQFARYHKRILFHSETELFTPGQQACILRIHGWRLGLAICYDAGFPEHARAAALEGCDAYLVSALFSRGNGYHESRIWLPARALDNTLYVLMSNHVGTTGGWQTCGASAIWGPDGNLLIEAGGEQSDVISAELKPAILQAARERETMLSDFVARGDACFTATLRS